MENDKRANIGNVFNLLVESFARKLRGHLEKVGDPSPVNQNGELTGATFSEASSLLLPRWYELGRRHGKNHMIIWSDKNRGTVYPEYRNLKDEDEVQRLSGKNGRTVLKVFTYRQDLDEQIWDRNNHI